VTAPQPGTTSPSHSGSPGNSRFNNFDALRFLGAFLVFATHATFIPTGSLWADPLYALSNGQMTIGWVGVALFFVLSGYLVTQSWARRPSPAAFLRARALRIYPALIAVVVGIFLVGGFLSRDAGYFVSTDAREYLLNILVPFSDNKLPGLFTNLPTTTVSDNFWTLRYEIGCYLLLVLMGALRVWRRDVVLVLFGLVTLIFLLGGQAAQNGWFDLPRYFLAGALFALYRDRIPLRGGIAALSLAVLVACTFLGGLKIAFSVFGAYLVLYLAFARWLPLQTAGRYGDFSYGLYLVGFFVQQVVQRAWPNLGMLENFLISLPPALVVSVLLWHLVEKPALALKSPRSRVPQPRPKPVPMRREPRGAHILLVNPPRRESGD